MNPEKRDNPLNIPGFKTPERIDPAYYDRLFWHEKQETLSLTCKNQQAAFKITLEENLAKWIDIANQSEFDYLKNILEKYKIIPNLGNTTFGDINWGIWITLKKVGDLFKVYNNPVSSRWTLIAQQGEIKNGAFTKTNEIITFFEIDSTGDNSKVRQDIWECAIATPEEESKAKETPKTKNIPETKKAPENPPRTHTSYEIKKWDFLWRIIKEQYGLSDSPWDIRDIWNIIEKIKKDPKNKGVIKDEIGKIYTGDTLHLPQIVSFQYKGWKRKEFTLVEKDTTPAS